MNRIKTIIFILAVLGSFGLWAKTETTKRPSRKVVAQKRSAKKAVASKSKKSSPKSSAKKSSSAKQKTLPTRTTPQPTIRDLQSTRFDQLHIKPVPRKFPTLNGYKDESQARQNAEINRERLTRFQTDAHLTKAVKTKLLVPLPKAKGLKVDQRLNPRYRYCRPFTRIFLLDLAYRSRKEIPGTVWQINSASRSIARQRQIAQGNGNAAARSSHVTGATIDITKLGQDVFTLEWMRKHLLKLEGLGLIEAVEEWNQPVFHIMVFETYTPYRPAWVMAK